MVPNVRVAPPAMFIAALLVPPASMEREADWTETEPELVAVPNAGYDAWVAAFMPRAAAQGIGQGTLDSAFRSAGYLPGVIERDRNQTEYSENE